MQKFIVKYISVQRPENYQAGDMNKAIEAELIRWQDELGEQYTLIGCVPAGDGVAPLWYSRTTSISYLTAWIHLPEDRDAKSDDKKSIAEDDCSIPPRVMPRQKGIMDEVFGEKRAQMYIGDSPVHDIEFGDIVCINGVNFKLTHFGQDYEEAMATLTPLKEVTQQETEPARVTYAQRMGTRTDYMGPRIHHNGTPWSPRG